MSLHSARIDVYGKTGSGGSYSSITKKTFVPDNLSFSYGIESRADKFQVSFDLDSVTDFSVFKIDDQLKVYGIIDGVETLLVDGILQKIKVENRIDREVVVLDCMNRLEKMFNGLVATTGETVNKTATQWLRDVILAQLNNFNKNQQITWHEDNVDTTKLVPFTRGYTPAIQLIEELSRPEFTGDSNYIYYLTNDNKLVFKKRPTGVTSTISWGTGIKDITTEKAMWELINYIILNCGKNLYNSSSILELGYNVESINEYGWKMKVVLNMDISDELKTKELSKQSTEGVKQNDVLFPSSYPYTTSWGVEVNSDFEYNSEFVDEVRRQGKVKINSLLKDLGTPTYRTKISTLPTFGYVAGNLYTVTNSRIGWNPSLHTNLRLEGVNYVFNKKGWQVELSLKEDEDENIVY